MFAWKDHLRKLHQKIQPPIASSSTLKNFETWRENKNAKAKIKRIKKTTASSSRS